MELGILVKRQACPVYDNACASKARGSKKRIEEEERNGEGGKGENRIFEAYDFPCARDHPSEIEQQGAKSGGRGQRTKSWKESGSTA